MTGENDTRRGRSWAMTALLCAAVLIAACGGGDREEAMTRAEEPRPAADEGAGTQAAPVIESVVLDVDGETRHLSDLPFDHSWDLVLPAPVHMSWMDDQIHGLLFMQLTNGQIHGIDIYSGETRWVTRPLPKLIKSQHQPCVVSEEVRRDNGEIFKDERLYVISEDKLFVFDCHYGQLIWRYHLGRNGSYGFEPSSGPFAIGSLGSLRVFVGDWEGRIRVVAYEQEKDRPYLKWQFPLRAVASAQPTGMEGLTYVGDRGGMMRCFDLDREVQWIYNARAPIIAPGMVRGRTLYFGAEDNIMHAIDRRTGRELGALFLESPVRSRPFAFNDDPHHIYAFAGGRSDVGAKAAVQGLHSFYTADDNIPYKDVEKHYLEVERMAKEWFAEGITRVVASSPGHLYVTRKNSNVILDLDRRTGEINWNWSLDEERKGEDRTVHLVEYTDSTDEIRTIVTVNADGHVIAYRLFGHQR